MSNKLFCQALCGSCNSAVTRTSDIHGFQNLVSVQIGGSRTDLQPPHSTECTELFSRHPAAMRSVPDFAQFPPILNHFLPFEFTFLNQDNKTARLCKSLYEGSDLLGAFCDTLVSIYTRRDASAACKERLHLGASASLWTQGVEILCWLRGQRLLSGTCTLHTSVPDEAVEMTCNSCPSHHFIWLQLHQVLKVDISHTIYLGRWAIPQICPHGCLLLLKFHSSPGKKNPNSCLCH